MLSFEITLYDMVRKIIFYENHFMEFYQNQDEKVKSKIQYVFELIKQVERVPKKFLEHLKGTDGLFEVTCGIPIKYL
jgi:hypothetical protein